jgi:D-glycero-alpha-D-manno-heptose-7-phosphate kinase
VKAFMEHLNLPLDDYHLAALAFKIEREDCGLQGGRQDQYAATFGGFSFMEFYEGQRAVINSLRIKNWIACELEASLLLFDTGVSRESARIIADQSANVKSGQLNALEAMHCMKQEALQMKECLLRGDFSGIVASMQEGWANKKRSATTVSNPRIDAIFQSALDAGARAGKISGAGGGGFIMFYVDPARRMDVIRCLQSHGGQVSHAHFTHQGTQAWRL